MPLFYRGAGVGTYWHRKDARTRGFQAWNPGATPSLNAIIRHIVTGTVVSPFVSLTRSYGVARWYALMGQGEATRECPGHVYELELDEPAEYVHVVDPLQKIVESLPDPLEQHTYHHDGGREFLLGVVAPEDHRELLARPYPQPEPGGGTERPPRLSAELEAMVRVLRDAEVLVVGSVPAICVRNRFSVW